MRFAYIDSQGNEVSIPSVDALALRIELGAIGPDTELYDAQADRWGPAQTHEIFHTLSREVGGDGGFVAPPPPVATQKPPDPEPEPEADLDPEPEPQPEPQPDPEPEQTREPGPPSEVGNRAEAEAEAAEEPEHEGLWSGPAIEAELAGSGGPPEPPATPEADIMGEVPSGVAETTAPDDQGHDHDLGLDLTLADSLAPAPGEGDLHAEDEGEPFDFGGFGELELAGEDPEGPMPPPVTLDHDPVTLDHEETPDFGSGAHLGGGMELEQPMSEFSPDNPPPWMEQEGPTDGALDFSSGSALADDPGPSGVPASDRPAPPDDEIVRPQRRARPEPRSRPSPPRRTRKRSVPTGLLLTVVGLAAAGGGGWFVWNNVLDGGRAADTGPVVDPLPPVTIPDIPAELLPAMRDLGEASLANMIDELRALQAGFDLAAEPPQDWLAGVYLANASQFPALPEYWEGIERYVDQVRERDTQAFHHAYVAQLEAAEISGDTATMLLERADSGFLATREARFDAYRLMDDLVNASLDLHDFLLQNEQEIAYEPAGGVSRDPVLEAVPSSRALGEEMWDMVNRITAALDALGTLDRVTTERLTAVLFDRIRRAGFQ